MVVAPSARAVLAEQGITGKNADVVLTIGWFEGWSAEHGCGGFLDAVGDLTLMNEKWGPSVGWFQIRCLRQPGAFPYPDTLRVAMNLHDDVIEQVRAMWAISKQGTDFAKWSVYKSGKYEAALGRDYPLLTGHERAGEWSK